MAVFVTIHHVGLESLLIKRKNVKGYIIAAIILLAAYMGFKVFQDQHLSHRLFSSTREISSLFSGNVDKGPKGPDVIPFNHEKFIMDLLIALLLMGLDLTLTVLERYRRKEKEMLRAMEKGREREQTNDTGLYIRADRKYIKVLPETISFIRGMNEYIKIHFTTGQDPIMAHKTLKQSLEILPKKFVQVQRSYIVNMDFVKSVGTGKLILNDETTIPIGESFRKSLNEYMLTADNTAGNTTDL